MTKRTSLFARIALAITLVFTAAATALRASLMQNAYDFTNGFYTDDKLHSILRYSLIVFAVLAFTMAYIYIKERKSSNGLPETKVVTYVSFIPMCAFAGFLIYTFAKMLGYNRPGAATLVMCLFSIVAFFYFLTFTKKGNLGDSRAVLCSGSALVLLALVFGLYFNTSISYVNHSVILCYATCIFLMLSIVAEANGLLGRPHIRRYLACVPTAIVLSFTTSIPNIIYSITQGGAPITDFYYDIIILALGVFQLARLIAVCMTKPAEEV